MDPASALESCYTRLVGSKTPEWRGARRASAAIGPIAKSGLIREMHRELASAAVRLYSAVW